MLASKGGADYLGVGAMFKTSTKQDAKLVDINVLKEICQSTRLPVVAIGGINHRTVPLLRGSGIRGIAVISAIFAQDDIVASTKAINTLAKTII
jgi:thiamine-phosphate pyrophosphorylase